jgi:transposase
VYTVSRYFTGDIEVGTMDAREQRGLLIAATCKIVQKNGFWTVPSQTGNGSYRVCLAPAPFVPQCTCPDYEERKQPCKHVHAVQYVIQREANPDGTETVTESVTLTSKTTAPRKTYKQNWNAYDQAQTKEKTHFQSLLCDLCHGIPEPPRKPGKGRKPIPLADLIFSVAFKVYSTVSARRFMCDLGDAASKGFIAKAPHFTAISDTLESPDLTPILRALIAESAKPLKSVEEDFAVDSSGFATSRFVRWFDHKYGCPRQEYDWVKVSVMTGVKTNVVTAVLVDEKKGGDCPQFKPLVNATAQNFKIREVSADAAYSSYENNDLVAGLGGTPFIAFPTNTTGRQGGTLAKMFHFYNFNRDEFLAHYHKRSNVETTFSMIKAKFGDHLRSKTDAALINEALCKILCHNICCLIQSAYELKIAAKFWEEAATPEPEPIKVLDFDPVAAFAWI